MTAQEGHLSSPVAALEYASDADNLRVPVGPGSLHVDRYGVGGPAVLLVHGFGTCSFVWRNVGPALALASPGL